MASERRMLSRPVTRPMRTRSACTTSLASSSRRPRISHLAIITTTTTRHLNSASPTSRCLRTFPASPPLSPSSSPALDTPPSPSPAAADSSLDKKLNPSSSGGGMSTETTAWIRNSIQRHQPEVNKPAMERRKVVVAALQFACTDDVSTNIDTAERLVRTAHKKGANIILIQGRPFDNRELFEGYYFCQAQREDFFQRAKPYKGHPTILRMQNLAKELGVVIPVSFFEEANNAHYNSIAIIDADLG